MIGSCNSVLGEWITPLRRLFGGRRDRDGDVPAPEEALPAAAAPAGAAGRRDRLGLSSEMLDRALAQKVLHGWLQNRNQVLVPLTLRLGTLEPEAVTLLMGFGAASLLAASDAHEDARGALRHWLVAIGADETAIQVFDRALAGPSALNPLLDGLRARQLEAYGYAVATMAADLRIPSGRLYADFVAARLALPADAVRSINRRYRR